MRPRAFHILLLLCVLAAGTGCGRRARVIPEKKMSRIYARMFLADQWVRDHMDARKTADTTLLFDPIFREEGVTFEDYDRSLLYYLDRPEQYARILTAASEQLRAEGAVRQMSLNAERSRQTEREQWRRSYRWRDFSSDSLRWQVPGTLWPVHAAPDTAVLQEAADTLRAAPTAPADEAEAGPAVGERPRRELSGPRMPRKVTDPQDAMIMIEQL